MPISLKQAVKQGGSWVKWLEGYGIKKFYRSFMRHAQNAEGECVYCHSPIYLDIAEGGGVPDWCTANGDYGCFSSPDTSEEGSGSHMPRKLHKRARR